MVSLIQNFLFLFLLFVLSAIPSPFPISLELCTEVSQSLPLSIPFGYHGPEFLSVQSIFLSGRVCASRAVMDGCSVPTSPPLGDLDWVRIERAAIGFSVQ